MALTKARFNLHFHGNNSSPVDQILKVRTVRTNEQTCQKSHMPNRYRRIDNADIHMVDATGVKRLGALKTLSEQ